jgi:two-component system, OmpR family, response regulator AdeR
MNETVKLALIIEDDPDAAFISRRAMLDNGLKVEVVSEGNRASETLRQIVPDVILLDLHLPNVSGLDLLKQIRNTPALSGTKVVLITADYRMAETVQNDADMVLIKPVTYSQVRDLIKRIVSTFSA